MVKVSKDQELVHPEPMSHPKTEIEKNQILIQGGDFVSRVSSYFSKGGHSLLRMKGYQNHLDLSKLYFRN